MPAMENSNMDDELDGINQRDIIIRDEVQLYKQDPPMKIS
jgi:hypothetical protein